ncbi:MAG: hypothetical protein M0R03_15970 [Novosphingobium sp.]|nr:hypothetical protein [Novosphingobium sp.]
MKYITLIDGKFYDRYFESIKDVEKYIDLILKKSKKVKYDIYEYNEDGTTKYIKGNYRLKRKK